MARTRMSSAMVFGSAAEPLFAARSFSGRKEKNMATHIMIGLLTLALIGAASYGFVGVKAPDYEAPRYSLICAGLAVLSFLALLGTE